MKLHSIALLTILLVFISCSDDNDTNNPSDTSMGQLELSLTDAPIDNAEVKSCFVTIAAVEIDGIKLEGFTKTSVDLLSYQNGNTLKLGSYDIEVGNKSKISFILDFDKDASGNTPGCYITKGDGSKDPLTMTSNVITINHNTKIENEQSVAIVTDFDLRKSIQTTNDSQGNSNYEFVTNSEISSAVRIIDADQSGIVKGQIEGNNSSNDKVVAYIYQKGSFSQGVEMSGQGTSQITFGKAVNSATVDANGKFELHFLPEGDYDIYIAAYKNDSQNNLQLQGLFSVGSLIDQVSPIEVSVNSNATATINISLSGLISL